MQLSGVIGTIHNSEKHWTKEGNPCRIASRTNIDEAETGERSEPAKFLLLIPVKTQKSTPPGTASRLFLWQEVFGKILIPL